MKIIIKTVLAIIVLVAILCVVSGPVAKWYIQKHDKELIGRKITIDKIFLNPITGKLNVKGLTLFEKDDQTAFVSFRELKYGMNLFALVNKKAKVRKIHLDSLNVNIIQRGQSFNFDDILSRFSSKEEQESTSGSKWIIDLRNISIARSNISYTDLQVGSHFGLERVSIGIPRVYLAGEDTDAGVNLNFEKGGSLAARLSYNIDHSKYNLALNIKDFGADALLPYLRQHLDVGKTSGLISLNANIKGETEHIMNADIDGVISLKNAVVTDKEKNMLFALDSMRSEIARLNFETGIAHFKSLYVYGAQTQYIIYPDSTNNFTGLLSIADNSVQIKDEEEIIPEDSTSISKKSGHKEMDLTIATLRIADGTVTYTDKTMRKEFQYKLSEISTECDNFALDKHNKLSGKAVLGRSGKVSMDWVTDFKSMRNMDLVLILNNIDIKDFTPYSYHYVGNNIENGKLQILSHNIVKNNKLDGKNKVEIYNPKVSKRINKKPVYKLPVRFGVYVLTDRKGTMAMNLPVSGDLDNPQFSYRKLIFKALANLLIKVSTAPFSALGDLFASGDENLDKIEIDARTPDFSPKEYAEFEKIVNLMNDKQELIFTFAQKVNISKLAPADSSAVSESAETAAPDSTASPTHDTLRVLTKEKVLELARSRNENLRKYLLRMGVSPKRFAIEEISADSLMVYKGEDVFSISATLQGGDD